MMLVQHYSGDSFMSQRGFGLIAWVNRSGNCQQEGGEGEGGRAEMTACTMFAQDSR